MTTIFQTFPKATVDEDRAAVDAAIARVLDSGVYILGPEVEAFEQSFAAYIGVGHAVGVANGTDALELALRAVGVGPGDVVATVSHTAVATATAVRACGAEPLWIDIVADGFVMDPAALERRVAAFCARPDGARLKAVVAVHLYGDMAPIEPISGICRRYGLKLIEDCAQAHGAMWNGKRAGSFGDAAAFSFYPTKNLGGIGDGGMTVAADPATAERVRLLRQYGWKERYISSETGTNSRLDPLQAAILGVMLPRLDERNDRRRALAAVYDAALAGLSGVTTPQARPGVRHVYHQYVIRVADRDGLAAHLKQHGVGTAVHYPAPAHLQPAYLGSDDAALPETEKAAAEVLSLPMYPQSPLEGAARTAALIAAFLAGTP
jgi:dTDP-4-amino-4,6-dideoxygalactose transaminase